MTSENALTPEKKALLAIRHLRAKLEALERAKTEPIAVVGMGCRFPGGVQSPDDYWQLLSQGVDAITEVPAERWEIAAYYDPDPNTPGKMATRWGGFLNHIDQFDPQFFGISPREALSMDPQQRLLLETAWEALEQAGIAPDRLIGSQTGVFVGLAIEDYAQLQLKSQHLSQIDAYFGTGFSPSVASGRLSYVLGLQGPSLTLNTACSSSLVTVHLACQSLRNEECDLALAGGVNLVLGPETSITLSQARMMASDGRCKTFDARADGFVRAEGCGIVALKRLADAQADGDNILALIRGSAVNQDGRSSGLTAPNGPSQETVIRTALQRAGIEPHQISYVETHGTGTELGDPIEIQALGAVLGPQRTADHPLLVGSVKTNIGHAESAAGIASLIKVVLMLQAGEIPPHLHFQTPNPHIDWEAFQITIPTRRTPWPANGEPRYAGVSSFGFSGTNAHVVLAEAPPPPPKQARVTPPLQLLCLSAKSEAALAVQARQWHNYLRKNPSMDIANVCATAAIGRAHFDHRLAIVTDSHATAINSLADFTQAKPNPNLQQGLVTEPPEIAFLFAGQGTQYLNMGRGLYETQPTFRKIIQECDEILRPYLPQSLITALYPEQPHTLLEQTLYTQPALFALTYALASLWQAWGVQPGAVMGHSLGEYAAACVAGVFSLEEGLRLVVERGRLMDSLPSQGEMAVLFTTLETAQAAIAPYVEQLAIAAINGPETVVISGAQPAMAEVLETLKSQGVRSRRLAVSQASHSPLVEPMLPEFRRLAGSVTYRPAQIEIVSGQQGQGLAAKSPPTADYWVDHLRQPVKFSAAMQTLAERGYTCFVEIGPGSSLLSMGQRCLVVDPTTRLFLPSLRSGREDWQQMLETLSTLYITGVAIDWSGLGQDYSRSRLSLPTYPWQRQRYWLEPSRLVAQVDTEETFTSPAPAAPVQPETETSVPIPEVSAAEARLRQLNTVLPAERLERLIDYVRQEVAHVLRLPDSQSIRQKDRLMDLGLDSLMAIELRTRLGEGLELPEPLSATLIFDYPTSEAIARHLDQHLFVAPPEPVSAVAPPASAAPDLEPSLSAEAVGEMSDEDVETLLLKKLADLSD